MSRKTPPAAGRATPPPGYRHNQAQPMEYVTHDLPLRRRGGVPTPADATAAEPPAPAGDTSAKE